MKNDLKLKIKIADQVLTLWEITKQADSYIMFRASASSSKKNDTGGWDNVNHTFTCFAYEDMKEKFLQVYEQRAKVKVSGFMSVSLEKRAASRNGNEYQETIMSNQTISIYSIEPYVPEVSGYGNEGGYRAPAAASDNSSISNIDDDIPF